ncbi:hypothetical protein HELRODRAFT_190994 [Helobdella robusta]|uniref:PNPLA domain-containing protein n=1 Tax=Helobdella robusta TaxID=6412 RepID=T1FSH4_HELRO|nr:hypothetical protein HELRODRAFT_190994 [Helobdella robusta]ESO07609.1 hypothetical protein HELRODRAFT_190994 [Helobdella robusta]
MSSEETAHMITTSILEQYQYPFENVVFEGGDNKVLAYCGAVKVLEESGVWKQIERLAGSGTGAVVAAFLAVGYNSQQLKKMFQQDLQQLNSKCCSCCIPLSTNNSVLKLLSKKIKESSGNKDLTFAQLYSRFKKELCVVVANLTRSDLELHHVKTTPDLPVIQSVRMSLANPVTNDMVKERNKALKVDDVMTGGGLLANYPLHVFDGWWLSLQEDDSFMKRMTQLADQQQINRERFNNFNNKTIGFITIDDRTIEQMLSAKLVKNVNEVAMNKKPYDTQLFKNLLKISNERSKLSKQYKDFLSQADTFTEFIKTKMNSKVRVSKQEDAVQILKEARLTDDDVKLLFGTKKEALDQIVNVFNNNNNEQKISLKDPLNLERRRKHFEFVNYHMRDNQNAPSKIYQRQAVENLLRVYQLNNIFENERNVDRTIMINTKFINSTTTRKSLKDQDRMFLDEQGQNAMKFFLEEQTRRRPLLKDVSNGGFAPEKDSYSHEDLKQFIDDDISEVIDEKDYMESYLERVL